MKILDVRECYLSNNLHALSKISTGEIFVNRNTFKNLNEWERTFILLHEAGHIEKETANEIEADNYALLEFIKLGFNPIHIISAMERVLTKNAPNLQRIEFMKQKIKSKSTFNSIDGSLGDWLSWGSDLLGIGAQVAGGNTTEQQAAAEEKARLEKEAKSKQITSYVLLFVAIIAVIVLFNFKK